MKIKDRIDQLWPHLHNIDICELGRDAEARKELAHEFALAINDELENIAVQIEARINLLDPGDPCRRSLVGVVEMVRDEKYAE